MHSASDGKSLSCSGRATLCCWFLFSFLYLNQVCFFSERHISKRASCQLTTLSKGTILNSRKKHPAKEIESAISYAEKHGWIVKSTGKSSHAWCRLHCPYGEQNKDCRCGEFCMISVYTTPRSQSNHAKQIRRAIDNCVLKEDS
jgi:hypothetical protein